MSADSPVIGYSIKQSGGKLEAAGEIFDLAPYGWPVAKGSPLAQSLQQALEHLIQTGQYQTILSNWGVESGAIGAPVINGAVCETRAIDGRRHQVSAFSQDIAHGPWTIDEEGTGRHGGDQGRTARSTIVLKCTSPFRCQLPVRTVRRPVAGEVAHEEVGSHYGRRPQPRAAALHNRIRRSAEQYGQPCYERTRWNVLRRVGSRTVPTSNDPMVAVQQYVDAFNEGDAKAMAGNMCRPDADPRRDVAACVAGAHR